MSNIRKIKDCTWELVFSAWTENEATNPDWQELAKKRGYDSWEDWRLSAYAKPFQLLKANWALFEIENPAEFINECFGGPFSAWKKHFYGDSDYLSFSELAELKAIQEYDKFSQIMQNYPKESITIIVELNNSRRFVIEGMHRSCALALMHKKGVVIPEKLVFAIAKINLDKLPSHKGDKE